MELRLDGKTALVTGGSRGIGLAIARRFAEAGASVMLSSRKADGPGRVGGGDRGWHGADGAGEVDWTVANAGDPEQAEACVAATVERFGRLDILVNNAATNPYFGPMIDIDRARADKTVQVNQLRLPGVDPGRLAGRHVRPRRDDPQRGLGRRARPSSRASAGTT